MLAIIPARGGSKGIPEKNKKMFAGKPLLEWTIDTARKVKGIDRIVVSTDDQEIANIAFESGAEVVWRPEELSGDNAVSETAILHVLEIIKQDVTLPGTIVFLQCTSPLIWAEDVERAIEEYKEGNYDVVVAVREFSGKLWNRDGRGINHNPDQVRQPRQQVEKQYLETGAFYICRTELFLEKENRFCGKMGFVEIPAERALEIDTPLDWEIAETFKREQERADRASLIPKDLRLVVFDFDGVFTDNTVITDQDGKEAIISNKGDGLAINKFPWDKYGIDVMVLSSEKNKAGLMRCEKFPRLAYFTSKNKLQVLKSWAKKVKPERVLYVGNDLNDLECMKWAGCACAPADSYSDVIAHAQIILDSAGGNGAVREVLELIKYRKGIG